MSGSTLLEIKETVDKIGESWSAYRKTNDERIAKLEAGDKSGAAELGKKLSLIEADVTKFTGLKSDLEKEITFQRERIEELECRAKSPGKTPEAKRSDEYKATFLDWIRSKGQSPVHEAKMFEQMRAMVEHKDVTIGSGAAGGFAVPEEISRMITVLEKKMSPVRDLVKVVQVGTSDYKELVDIAGESSGWVGESGSRSATTTPSLREVTPTHGELYAYPQVSEWSLDDLFFNVEEWLSTRVARDFAIKEAEAVISGDGTNKPSGMLKTTPTTAADFASPLRAAGAYEYLASDLTPGGQGLLADILIDTVYRLNSIYRAGAQWIMNSATTGAIRKVKDSTNQYLWQPGLALGQPDRLLGYPVSTWEQMADIGSNNFPVGFGNWREAYVLADRVGMRITRDNVTAIGHIKFYVRRREGGIVLNNDAAKFIRTI